MSPSDIHDLARQISELTNHQTFPWLEYLIALLVLGAAGFLGAYFGEKGKNRATKEDIAAITREIKTVEHSFSVLEARLAAKQEMRMACLEERMRVHQQAYVHFRKIITSLNNKVQAAEVSQELEKWWVENCLFLDKEPREQFFAVVRILSFDFRIGLRQWPFCQRTLPFLLAM